MRKLRQVLENSALTPLVILVACLFGYWRLPIVPFWVMDDSILIFDNLDHHGRFGIATFLSFFSTQLNGMWNPFTRLFIAAEYYLFGFNAGLFHLVSLALHFCSGLAIARICRCLGGTVLTANIVAALFCLHPMNVESVLWASEQKGLLSNLAILLTIIAWENLSLKKTLSAAVTVVLAGLIAYLSKPSSLVLPLLLVIWELAKNGRSAPSLLVQCRIKWVCLLALGLGAIGCGAAGLWSEGSGGATNVEASAIFRIATFMVSSVFHLVSIIAPLQTAPLLQRPLYWEPVLVGICIIFLVALGYCAGKMSRGNPFPILTVLWVIVSIAPMGGLIPYGPHWTATRYAYLPLAGAFILGWKTVIIVYESLGNHRFKPGIFGLGIVWIVLLAYKQQATVDYWSHPIVGMLASKSASPKPTIACIQVGHLLAAEHSYDSARNCYLEALSYSPRFAYTKVALAQIAQYRHQLKRAEVLFKDARADSPNSLFATTAYGRFLIDQQRYIDAERVLKSPPFIGFHDPELLAQKSFVAWKLGDKSEARLFGYDAIKASRLANESAIENLLRQFIDAGDRERLAELAEFLSNGPLVARKCAENIRSGLKTGVFQLSM